MYLQFLLKLTCWIGGNNPSTFEQMRSQLHGQRCDTAKTLKLVEAHKDFAIVGPASGSWIYERALVAQHTTGAPLS